jgi:hypothetical protein
MADTMFCRRGVDAFIVRLHDQAHIAAKLQAPHATAGLAFGSPVLFSSRAHGKRAMTSPGMTSPGMASPHLPSCSKQLRCSRAVTPALTSIDQPAQMPSRA